MTPELNNERPSFTVGSFPISVASVESTSLQTHAVVDSSKDKPLCQKLFTCPLFSCGDDWYCNVFGCCKTKSNEKTIFAPLCLCLRCPKIDCCFPLTCFMDMGDKGSCRYVSLPFPTVHYNYPNSDSEAFFIGPFLLATKHTFCCPPLCLGGYENADKKETTLWCLPLCFGIRNYDLVEKSDCCFLGLPCQRSYNKMTKSHNYKVCGIWFC
jgi:hypothetical protein